MDDLTSGFFILIGLTYSYFMLQYFATQLFYSKYNLAYLFLFDSAIAALIVWISHPAERIENLLYCLGFFYFTLLLLAIKMWYKKLNHWLVAHDKIKPAFRGKGFTYVSYHKGILFKGHSWDEALATQPSWLDHLLSVLLVLLPIVCTFIALTGYRSAG